MAEGTVLFRRGALGDVVLLGAVTGVVEPPVTVVTDPRYLEVARRLRGVERAVAWGERAPAGRWVDLQGGLAGLRRAPLARHVDKQSVRRRLWMRGLAGPRRSVPEVYGRACGASAAPAPWIDLPAAPRDALALVPGAAWAPKRWDPARLVAVGRTWQGPVLVLGGPGEDALVAAVAGAVPGAEAIVEVGFERTFAALARVRVAVAGDTGLMHLAGATGAAVVALFGPTHPADGFFVYPGQALGLDLPCRPCALHRIAACPLGHRACLDLSVQRVVDALRRHSTPR